MVVYPSIENLMGCLSCIYGWILVSRFVFKWQFVYKAFIPFTIIFGYAICFLLFPLIVTFIEGKPITFRFNVPYLTFINQMIHITVIVTAFRIALKLRISGALSKLWEKFGYFKVPTQSQVWVMGGIGLVCLVTTLLWQGTNMMEMENRGIIGQIVNYCKFFAFFPIALFFTRYFGANYAPPKKKLILYLLLIVAIGIATTRRGTIFTGFFTIAATWLFLSIIAHKTIITNKTLIGIFICFYMITGPVADLATAMIINRQTVMEASYKKTFSKVWQLYQNKEKLHKAYKMATLSNTDNDGDNFYAWSEYYIDNILLDRFCNLRTVDITLDYAQRLGYDNKDMHKYFDNFIITLLPTPILKAMEIHIDKYSSLYTPGDLMSTKALGLRRQYFGYRVAGDTGIGLYLMGYRFYIFAFFVYIGVFVFFISLVRLKPSFIIPLPVLATTYFFYFNNSTGIFQSISLLLRNGIQNIIMYCLLFYVVRKLVR